MEFEPKGVRAVTMAAVNRTGCRDKTQLDWDSIVGFHTLTAVQSGVIRRQTDRRTDRRNVHAVTSRRYISVTRRLASCSRRRQLYLFHAGRSYTVYTAVLFLERKPDYG